MYLHIGANGKTKIAPLQIGCPCIAMYDDSRQPGSRCVTTHSSDHTGACPHGAVPIVQYSDGHYVIIGQINEERILVQDPRQPRPLALSRYVVLSLLVTPILRARLRQRFERGAENHAFLVEVVTGIETVKAMAVEPALQRRWDEQLAEYVRASFRATTLSNAPHRLLPACKK